MVLVVRKEIGWRLDRVIGLGAIVVLLVLVVRKGLGWSLDRVILRVLVAI